MLSARTIADRIEMIESALDLDDSTWLMGDMHLWPIYRMELYRLLFSQDVAVPTHGSARAGLDALMRPPTTNRRGRKPSSIWMVSDGISFSRIGDEELERFCTPLLRTAASLGHDAVIIDRGSSTRRHATDPYRWWAPATLRAKAKGLLLSKLAPDRRHETLVERVVAAARGGRLPTLDPRRFDALARAVACLARWVEPRMRREGVTAMFLVGYYDVAGYGYVLAAARAGIPSIDVQHGLAGPLHMGYAKWWKAPVGGLRLLPTCFWTWSEADAQVIRTWAPSHAPRRTAVAGGNPFVQMWRSGQLDMDARRPPVQAMAEGCADHKPCVLVTLQPNVLGESALAPLIAAWQRASNVRWWVRLHPLALKDRPVVERLLRSAGVDDWNIEQATSLPLLSVLARVDIHATHSSSAVTEAELLGVPSIVWSQYGAELVPDAIERGVVRVALDGDDFVKHLNDILQQPPASPSDQPDMRPALHALLGSTTL